MPHTSEEHVDKKPKTGDEKPVFLVFGKTGWVGGLMGKILAEKDHEFSWATARLEDREGILADIEKVKPTHVINCAGITGRPNVDWCEDHKLDTIRVNVVGTLSLALICHEKGLHLTNFATGCIYSYDDAHALGSGEGFKEDDPPNFIGSFYSKTKAMVDELLKNYDNVLNLRLRMPISEDLDNSRNFIFKIRGYDKIVNIPNSMTILPEMLPLSLDLALRKHTGNVNFTNPGVVSHGEIMEMVKEYISPEESWTHFSEEEQTKILKAPRSNNELDVTLLKSLCPSLLPIKESLIKYVFEPAKASGSGSKHPKK